MSGKDKKDKKDAQIFEQVDQLQAIVILETYLNKFEPLTEDTPECLLPLLGKPLIDYTVEYLIEQNVEDIQLYFTKHSATIKNYVNKQLKTNWHAYANIIKCNIVKSDSFGETMRCIYSKNSEVRKTFVLVTTPGLITNNIVLKDYFDAHIQRLSEDKSLLLTSVCTKKATFSTTNKCLDDTLIVHDSRNCILYYDRFNASVNRQSQISLPKNVMDYLTKIDSSKKTSGQQTQQTQGKSSATLQLRVDLRETNLFICQHALIQEFDDNFDALTLCDLLKQLLQNELSGHTIYYHLINEKFGSYMSSISNLNEYFIETMKLLQRYQLFNRLKTAGYIDIKDVKQLENNVKPVNNLINVYFNRKFVSFGANVNLKRNLYLDLNCKIGNNCELVNCYIGKNCRVDDNVSLSNCILLDNTHVCGGVVLNGCVLGENVRVGANSRICENTLFGNNCFIDDETVVDKHGLFYVDNEDDGFDDDDDEGEVKPGEEEQKDQAKTKETDKAKSANYTRYNPNSLNCQSSDDEDEDMDDDYEQRSSKSVELKEQANKYDFYIWPFKSQTMTPSAKTTPSNNHDENADDAVSTFEIESSYDEESESEYDSDEDGLDEDGHGGKHDDEDDDDDDLDDDEKAFLNELNETVKRYLKEKQNADNIVLEINGCKHAAFVQIDDLFCYLIRALLQFPEKHTKFLLKLNNFTETSTYLEKCKFLFTWYRDLIKHYSNVTKKKSPLLFVSSLTDFFIATNDKQFVDLNCVKLFHYLNQELDILPENQIIDWFASLKQLKNLDKNSMKHYVMVKLEPFVKWLQEAEEEDDEDEDDD